MTINDNQMTMFSRTKISLGKDTDIQFKFIIITKCINVYNLYGLTPFPLGEGHGMGLAGLGVA
jgi:hypothetical protein